MARTTNTREQILNLGSSNSPWLEGTLAETRTGKIYLAGKVQGAKWELAKRYQKEETEGQDAKVFIASDGDTHGDHGWIGTYSSCGDFFSDNQYQELVNTEVLSRLINESDGTIAYLNSHNSFGSIAEIAFASAYNQRSLSRPQLLIIECPRCKNEDCDEPACQDCEKWLDMHDAYWFVSNFPGVRSFVTKSSEESYDAFKQCADFLLRLESPIERLLMWAMPPQLFLDCRPQMTFEPHPMNPKAASLSTYRIDLFFPKYKLIVECDGQEHHSSQEARTRDARRDRFFVSKGYAVLRFTGSEIVKNAARCVQEIVDLVINLHPEMQEDCATSQDTQ